MFELFAKQYYECYDDEATIVRLLNQIGKYGRRASAFMTDEVKNIIGTNHSFHDWYLTKCALCCEQMTKFCKLTVSKNRESHDLLFSGIVSLQIFGELISDEAIYPESERNCSLAQILDMWFDYRTHFEFCLLLDNERFVLIKAKDFCFRK